MHRELRNDSASILRFSECVAISRVDSEHSFEQQMALHALETAVLQSKSLHTLEPKIIIYKIRKG